MVQYWVLSFSNIILKNYWPQQMKMQYPCRIQAACPLRSCRIQAACPLRSCRIQSAVKPHPIITGNPHPMLHIVSSSTVVQRLLKTNLFQEECSFQPSPNLRHSTHTSLRIVPAWYTTNACWKSTPSVSSKTGNSSSAGTTQPAKQKKFLRMRVQPSNDYKKKNGKTYLGKWSTPWSNKWLVYNVHHNTKNLLY